jgi:hypothetical protein
MIKHDDEIRSILCDLLRTGLLRIRAFGTDGLAEQCSIEADHLHNLPALLQTLQLDRLSYYYNVERPAYIKQVNDVEQFEPQWERLKKLLSELSR